MGNKRIHSEKSEELLLSCVHQLNSTADFDGVMNHVLFSILTYYEGSRAYVFEFDWDNRTTTNTHEVCAPGISPAISDLSEIPLEFADPWIHAFEHHEDVFVIEDVESLAQDPLRQGEYETLTAQNIHSLIAVPIRYGKQLHGFLGVDDPLSNQDDSAFLISLAYFICNEMHKRQLSDELRQMSFSDYLTQFNNRNAYTTYLQSVSGQPQTNVGVLFADLNALKYMNDTFGHEYGDKLLRHMASVLRRHFDDENIYRISGDEFVIICANWPNGYFHNCVAQLQNDLEIQKDELASIGYVWVPHTENIPELVFQAEQLMYKSKQEYHSVTRDQDACPSDLLQLFLKDMEKDNFTFYLQPQFRLRDHTVVCAEALARRITPEGELVFPYEFIPLYEKEGLIQHMDFYLFEQICAQIAQWKTDYAVLIPIAVNFSIMTLSEQDFCDHFLRICRKYKVNPEELTIEISRAHTSLERRTLKAIIQDLHNAGIRICIKNLTIENDFLAVLTLDGVSAIKLDLSLTREMYGHYRTQLLVQTLFELSHRMKQQCMATGVETKEFENLLLSMDCDCAQGFLYSPALPISEFEAKYLQPGESARRYDAKAFTAVRPNTISPPAVGLLNDLDSAVFELLCQTSDKMYIYISDLRTDFSRWSPAAVRYFGLPGEYISDTASVWSDYIHPDDVSIFTADMQRIINGASNRHNCEYRARNIRGEYVWVQCSGCVLRTEDGTPSLFAGTMINLGSQSKYDALTGLPSPYEYQEQMTDILSKRQSGALLLFGLDHFKHFNDTQGYNEGDKLLRYVGQQVQLIPGCTFYRMDSDKLSCIIPGATRSDITFIFEQVAFLLRKMPLLQEKELHLTASCGAVYFPEDGKNLGEIRSNAEYALEQAKRDRRGSLAFYSPAQHRKSRLSFHLQEVLHNAIAHDFEGFSLHYQPLFHTESGTIYGAETLLRFSSPSLPPVSPDEFIPVLESSGMITEVGAWVMKNAFLQTAAWRKIYPDFHITFNVSYIQMQQADFRQTVMRELKYSDLPPEAVLIELTESCKITEPERLQADFAYFTKQHIAIALDDFGTGYSSISLLRELSPGWVKIDHTFVASITESSMDCAILEYILELCHHAGINVCVEGVETEAIREIVSSYHPDLLQGYYYSHPVPADVFEKEFLSI